MQPLKEMIRIFPEHGVTSLEYDKVKHLLSAKCRSHLSRRRVEQLFPQANKEFISLALQQTNEFKQTLSGSGYFPNDFTLDIDKELKLLSTPGAMLTGADMLKIKSLAANTRDLVSWFERNHKFYPALYRIAENLEYKEEIIRNIDEVIDETGVVRDNASNELQNIRRSIQSKRQSLRKLFDGIVRKLNKQGYLADISESFLNGRRTLAVFSEHKRIVKGIFHGESDSQKTVYIEPEETIGLNNELAQLEREEHKEVARILRSVTALLAAFHSWLVQYYRVAGIYDFIRAKAVLAAEMDAGLPQIASAPALKLIKAFHPLLYLQNKINKKDTVPLNIELDKKYSILIISGPNAGGKTVAMKTIGLLQMMMQSGLLIPASESSELGIFRQLMVHIGDTQSIEHELSTYSAHLRNMRDFMEHANGKTLFFIDELGSGSDPNLGGAFAEAIVEELAKKQSFGVITTHYLNLKVMAGKVAGIINGAMAFDEKALEPLYQLLTGKPGSSYTFAIATRSGLPKPVIERARELTDKGHFRLDKMLHETEKQSQRLESKEQKISRLIKENEDLKLRFEKLTNREEFKQQESLLKLQNQIRKDELEYLRDMERKFKQIITDWKKAENKSEVIADAEKVLFKRKQIQTNAVFAKKADKHYEVVDQEIKPGDFVRNLKNHQIGKVLEMSDKKIVVQIGQMPFHGKPADWVTVKKKVQEK